MAKNSQVTALANAINSYMDSKLETISGGSAAIISDFTGASASTAGLSGYVPAPQAGDNDKFLRGDGQWVTIAGGVSYPIASISQAGLMSAEDKQHLDSVFQDSADFTDAVIAVVGGNFFPSVDSVSDFITYKDSNIQFFENRIHKALYSPPTSASPYQAIDKSPDTFLNGDATVSIYREMNGVSLVSSGHNYVTLAGDYSSRSFSYYMHKISETAGFLHKTISEIKSSFWYSGIDYVIPYVVAPSGNVSTLDAVSICSAAASVSGSNRVKDANIIKSISDPNHLMFLETLGGSTCDSVNYANITFDTSTGDAIRDYPQMQIGIAWNSSVSHASKTHLSKVQNKFNIPSYSFSNGKVKISRNIDRILPFTYYVSTVYDSRGAETSEQTGVYIHHGLRGGGTEKFVLKTWTSANGETILQPWLEDNSNLIVGVWKSRTSSSIYALTVKIGTYDYSANWFDNVATIWTFDFLTPQIFKTTLKLSDIVNDLQL